MKIAVLSDSHDHIENIEKAVEGIKASADVLVHCGDLCSPFTIERLAAFGGPVHIVFGNNDGDRFAISNIARGFDNVHLHGEMGELETGSGRIAFTHYPRFAEGLAATGKYVAVFSGHTHKGKRDRTGGTLLANPGEIMGLFEKPGYVIYDSESGDAERIDI